MTTTADLMLTIERRLEYLAILTERLSQARRLAVLAEVTHGMASPDYRRARMGVIKIRNAIDQCAYDLQWAREELARLCEPWFRMEVYP